MFKRSLTKLTRTWYSALPEFEFVFCPTAHSNWPAPPPSHIRIMRGSRDESTIKFSIFSGTHYLFFVTF
jgi:hypothetical protein